MADSAELKIVLVDKGGPPSGPRESPREREASRPDRVESESLQKFGDYDRPTRPAREERSVRRTKSGASESAMDMSKLTPKYGDMSNLTSRGEGAQKVIEYGSKPGIAPPVRGPGMIAPTGEALAAANGATGLAASLGVAATAVGAVAGGLTLVAGAAVAAGASLKMFGNMIVDRGAELAKYSGAISQSRAMAEVREMRSDIREAEVLGPGIASVTDSMSQLWAEIREFLLPIKKFFIETFADIMKWLVDFVKEWKDAFIALSVTVTKGLEAMVEALVGSWFDEKTAIGILMSIPDEIVKAQEAAKAREKAAAKVDMLDDFIKRLEQNRPFGAAPADPFGNNFAKQQLNVPIFAGV